jgi:hypothetical protein
MKAIGDLDGDGRLDLVVVGRDGPAVWYVNPGWQKHTISSSTGPGGSSTDVTLGDLDSDGFPDVVLANGIWFENPLPGGDPTTAGWTRHDIDSAVAHDVVVEDLDLDGRLDVVKRDQGQAGDVIRVFRNDGSDRWTERQIPSHAGEGLALGDLDRDGDADIVTGRYWYENDGDIVGGAWNERAYTSAYTHPRVVVQVARVNGDIYPDIVIAPSEPTGDTYRIAWFEGRSDPTALWSEHVIERSVESVQHSLVVADVSGDRSPDVVVADMEQSTDPDRVRVFVNDGAQNFASAAIASGGSHNIQAGDLDRDGDLDLFGANWKSDTSVGAPVRLWWNQAQASPPTPPPPTPPPPAPPSVPTEQCRMRLLLAAGRLCQDYLACSGGHAARPERDPGQSGLEACVDKKSAKFSAAYDRALARSAAAGEACPLDDPAVDVLSLLSGAADEVIDSVFMGWDTADRHDNRLRSYLLKQAGLMCKTSLLAMRKDLRKPDAAKLASVLAKARGRLEDATARAFFNDTATTEIYTGPESAPFADSVENLLGDFAVPF